MFLESNIELISSIYEGLYRDLYADFMNVLPEDKAAEKAQKWLNLSKQHMQLASTNPWLPIIATCRKNLGINGDGEH